LQLARCTFVPQTNLALSSEVGSGSWTNRPKSVCFNFCNMEEDNENRSKWIKVRLKPSEEELLNKRYKKSTFQNLSEFGRAMILGKPVTIIHRDKSMDEVLEELILLRRELNHIGNNLNQAIRNINSAHGFPDTRLWMNLLTIINGKNKYSDLWSQKLKVERA